jgi:hypothetical protein
MKKLVLIACLSMSANAWAQSTIYGKVVSRVGSKLVLAMDSAYTMPGTKDTLDISKDLSGASNPFGIMISSGWMGVGKILYVSTSGKNATFKIGRETSNVVINGKKKEQFEVGKKMKIEWGMPDKQ